MISTLCLPFIRVRGSHSDKDASIKENIYISFHVLNTKDPFDPEYYNMVVSEAHSFIGCEFFRDFEHRCGSDDTLDSVADKVAKRFEQIHKAYYAEGAKYVPYVYFTESEFQTRFAEYRKTGYRLGYDQSLVLEHNKDTVDVNGKGLRDLLLSYDTERHTYPKGKVWHDDLYSELRSTFTNIERIAMSHVDEWDSHNGFC